MYVHLLHLYRLADYAAATCDCADVKFQHLVSIQCQLKFVDTVTYMSRRGSPSKKKRCKLAAKKPLSGSYSRRRRTFTQKVNRVVRMLSGMNRKPRFTSRAIRRAVDTLGTTAVDQIFNYLKEPEEWPLKRKETLSDSERRKRNRKKFIGKFQGVEFFNNMKTPHRHYAFAPPRGGPVSGGGGRPEGHDRAHDKGKTSLPRTS